MTRRGRAIALAALLLHAAFLPPAAVRAEPVEETSADERAPIRSPLAGDPRGFPWGLVAAGAGMAAGAGAAVWLKSEADDRYARYLATADPDAARAYFDDAQRYDRLSVIGWATAQVSFVVLFVLLTRDEEPARIPTRGEPLVRAGDAGVEVGWRVAP